MERDNFFTNAAHELRTPLTLILSPLQELLGTVRPSDTVYTKLAAMYRNGTSLQTLVDHLLYVQKIEAETEGINFTVESLNEPLLLWIDVEKISSAIRNLLSNAFKYTSPNGKYNHIGYR
eukprot:12401690-Prorocentrum_lima.AAC.1